MAKAPLKRRIADAFMLLVPQAPTRRVTVAELTRYLDIDRKTFYNHFDNIDNLMIWIYRDYLATMLGNPVFDEWEKTTSHPDKFDPYSDMPFYARNLQDGTLCQGEYFKRMAYHWENHRQYYSIVFSTSCYVNLVDYIIDLFLPEFRKDVDLYRADREMPDIVADFLAEYHVMGVFGRLRYHFTQTNKFIMQDELEPFWNYAHIMLRESVDSCYEPVERRGLGKLLSSAKHVERYSGFACRCRKH